MSTATDTAAWLALDSDIRQKFYSIASKSDEHGAFEWFTHLVPQELRDSPWEIRTWMDGNQALGILDRDVSRIVAGANGGEYTPENTIMEIASDNRARGGVDITDTELTEIVENNVRDITLIDGAEPIADTAAAVDAGSSFAGDVAEALVDGIAPAIAAVKVGTFVAKNCETDLDKVGYGSAAAGGAALIACTPVGQACVAAWGVWAIGKFTVKTIARIAG